MQVGKPCTLAEIMKHLFYILIISVLLPFTILSQTNSVKSNVNYDTLKYLIKNIDTIVSHYQTGKYGEPDFKRWDSTKIWADIIFSDLPGKIDSIKLKNRVITIMKAKGINKAFIFRNDWSSTLFRFSSFSAAQKLREIDGYLGVFNTE